LYRAWRTGSETTVISLGPLTETDVRELIRDMGHIEHPERGTRFSRRLFEVTEGNPHYLLEVLKALFDQGALVLDPSTGEWIVHNALEPGGFEMPGTIREAIAQRLQRLPEQLRVLLTTVTVGRVGCTPELLADVTDLPRLRVATLCDELVGRDLLVEVEGEYRPAHPLIAEMVRRDLSTSRLTELYRALALAMDRLLPSERSTLAGRLARHAERGGLPELARTHAVMAAEAAVQHLAFDEALRWLDMAAAQGEATEEIDRLTAEVLRLVGLAEMPASVARRDSLIQRLDPGDIDLRAEEDEAASAASGSGLD
jgi:predicted ATPase